MVCSASKAASYTDWARVAVVDNGFDGDPLIDQNRLSADAVLSVFLQEGGPSSTTPIGTPLHVVEFVVNVPVPNPVALSFIGSDVVITVSTQIGSTYQLQTTTSLSPTDWQNIGAAVAGNDGLIALPHADAGSDNKRFYRVESTQ